MVTAILVVIIINNWIQRFCFCEWQRILSGPEWLMVCMKGNQRLTTVTNIEYMAGIGSTFSGT